MHIYSLLYGNMQEKVYIIGLFIHFFSLFDAFKLKCVLVESVISKNYVSVFVFSVTFVCVAVGCKL